MKNSAKYPKVLLACPTNEIKDYCFEAWIENVNNFTYPNFAVFMADNSLSKSYSKRLLKAGITAEWIKPRGKSLMKRIAESHELCRRYALHYNFDYLFHLESDIFPQRTIIEDLLSIKRSVSAALYHIGQGANSEIMVQVEEPTDDDHYTATRPLGMDAAFWMDGSVKKVFHAGLGCILIHKNVLPHFVFRYEEGKNFHPDSYFAMDLHRKGIEIYVDTAIICHHDNRPHELMAKI